MTTAITTITITTQPLLPPSSKVAITRDINTWIKMVHLTSGIKPDVEQATYEEKITFHIPVDNLLVQCYRKMVFETSCFLGL
jgi:hypothetical protein